MNKIVSGFFVLIGSVVFSQGLCAQGDDVRRNTNCSAEEESVLVREPKWAKKYQAAVDLLSGLPEHDALRKRFETLTVWLRMKNASFPLDYKQQQLAFEQELKHVGGLSKKTKRRLRSFTRQLNSFNPNVEIGFWGGICALAVLGGLGVAEIAITEDTKLTGILFDAFIAR